MNDRERQCHRLESLLHREVPLSETIGVSVREYDGRMLELRADLAPNINVHGVAFGGSIYSICALAGWGLLVLRLEEAGLESRVMLAGAEIQYLKSVRQSIKASTSFSSEKEFDDFVEALVAHGKKRIKIPVAVALDGGEIAAEFTGDYMAFDKAARRTSD